MRQISLCIVVAIVMLGLGQITQAQAQPAQAEEPTPVLTLDVVPKRLFGTDAAQLFISVDLKAAPVKTILSIAPPPGLKSDPAEIVLETPPRQFTQQVSIMPDASTGPIEERPIVVSLSMPGSSRPQPVVSKIALTYIPQLSLTLYLLCGSAGIAVGYLLRLLVKVLAAVPPPPAAPVPPGPPPGPITKLVTDHYYKVDFAVTCVLGFLALLYLSHLGRPPENASQWPSAVTLGVALGGLSNSELFSKLGK